MLFLMIVQLFLHCLFRLPWRQKQVAHFIKYDFIIYNVIIYHRRQAHDMSVNVADQAERV